MKKNILNILLVFIALLFQSLPVIAADNTGEEFPIVSGVVPHHMLAKEIIEEFFSYIAGQRQLPDTIILLSPDHLNNALLDRDTSFITVPWESGNAKLGDIPVDCKFLEALASKNILKQNHGAVLSDFGITNLLPFIREYFPETTIIPLLMPADIAREQITSLVNTINEISSPQTMIIASVDFSHYLPPEAASFHDIRSIRILLNFEEENFENIEVDCWQCLYASRLFAKLRGKENLLVVSHKNSVHFLPLDFDKTTSYFSVVFQDEKLTEGFIYPDLSLGRLKQYQNDDSETILLAGDVMLDRGVEELINRNSVYYPFQKIIQLLRGIDIVFANLEGPIIENPPDFAGDSLRFACHQKILEGIRWSKINLFSLANNHSLDMGKDGLEETIEWLGKYQINVIGDPLSYCTDRKILSFSTDHSVFLAFHQVLPFIQDREEIIKEVAAAKLNNPEKFLIVSMHWGIEYQSASSPAQRELAHQIIAAGADLIVGHHPHVVQEIEMYQDKLIFYSLGNFIFDQDFSPETQIGLTVGLAIYPDKMICRLFPVHINLCQPTLMNQSEAQEFLKNLAEKSDKRLWDGIERGIIEANHLNKIN